MILRANHGIPYDLTVAGVDVGRTLYEEGYTKPWYPSRDTKDKVPKDGDGRQVGFSRSKLKALIFPSIIVVIATDAPLLPHQVSMYA